MGPVITKLITIGSVVTFFEPTVDGADSLGDSTANDSAQAAQVTSGREWILAGFNAPQYGQAQVLIKQEFE